MLESISSVVSEEHRARGCYMKIEVTPRLLDIVMQIGQTRPFSTSGYCVFVGGNLIS